MKRVKLLEERKPQAMLVVVGGGSIRLGLDAIKKAPVPQCARRDGRIAAEEALRPGGCEVVEGSSCPDYVHACVRIPPRIAVPDVMGYVKGKSAMALRDRHPV